MAEIPALNPNPARQPERVDASSGISNDPLAHSNRLEYYQRTEANGSELLTRLPAEFGTVTLGGDNNSSHMSENFIGAAIGRVVGGWLTREALKRAGAAVATEVVKGAASATVAEALRDKSGSQKPAEPAKAAESKTQTAESKPAAPTESQTGKPGEGTIVPAAYVPAKEEVKDAKPKQK